MLDLDPIKARLAAATPGPWTASPNVQPRGVAAVAEVNTVLVLSSGPLYGSPMQDASLIAHAPADLAALVAEVEWLRNELSAAQKQRDMAIRMWKKMEAAAADGVGAILESVRLRDAIKRHRDHIGGMQRFLQETDEELWQTIDNSEGQ